MGPSLAAAAAAVLGTADPAAKVRLSRTAAEAWRQSRITAVGHAEAPARPARPERPIMAPPRAVPRRAITTAKGRIALLHALAHIELNAIDLAWDLIVRASEADLPRAFYDDWVTVAVEEASHFALLAERLAACGAAYGDLPAHDGLWQAAEDTKHDLLARLAVVPLVLEARGLDVAPAMIDRLTAAGDRESAAVLEIIYRDEIGHVAVGKRWFDWLCAGDGRDPAATWQALVRRYFKGRLKPPFNEAARAAAGLSAEDYLPLSTG
jgi:uncharacterized ferritin-like protein (DUF455 family)